MEKILKLYTYVDGVNDTPFPSEEHQVVTSDFRSDYKRMGAVPTISCTIMHNLCLDKLWTDNVYAEFKGEKFFIKQTATSSYDNTDSRYKHEVELVSERIILDNVYVFDVVTNDVDNDKPVSNSTKFTFFGTIHEFAERLNYSLQYSKLDYRVIVDDGVTSEGKLISFENQFFSNALQESYNTYEIPYYFVGKKIHIGFTDNAITHTFKYGVDESLLSIQKSNANAKIVNRITGVGSADNIPYYYPNNDEKGETRLLYNGEVGSVSINNVARFKKVKLGDVFSYKVDEGGTTPLWVLDEYNISEPTYLGEELDGEGNIIQGNHLYRVNFSYSFPIDIYKYVIFEVDTHPVGYPYDMELKEFNLQLKEDTRGLIGTYYKSFSENLGQGNYVLQVNAVMRLNYKPEEISLSDFKEIINIGFFINATYEKETEKTWYLDGAKVALDSYGITITNTPKDGDKITFEQVSYLMPQENLMPTIYRESEGKERFYNALNETYISPQTNDYYQFENPYVDGKPKEHFINFEEIKPTIVGITNAGSQRIDMFSEFAYDENDNDEMDEEGNYIHPYFFGKLRRFDGDYGFNLFEHAIDEGEMTISMTSGNCGGCEWVIGVDEDTQKNIVQVNEYGNLLRDDNGNVKRSGIPQERQNDTSKYEVWVALKKDINTFGIIMPNATSNYRPNAGDTFVILHIDLPKAYILAAEKKLEEELIKYMAINNSEKFNFSISFSRIFFAENPDILEQLNENARIQIEYDNTLYELYVSSYSYNMSNDTPLPEIKVELSDTLTVSQNAIQNAVDSVKHDIMSSVGSIDFLKQGLRYFIRKDVDDRAKGKISTDKAFEVGEYVSGSSGAIIYKDPITGQTIGEMDKLYVRMKAYFETLEIINAQSIGGKQIISPVGSVACVGVDELDDAYRCYFLAEQDGEVVQNRWKVNDQAYSQMFNANIGVTNKVSNHYYWRLVTNVSDSLVEYNEKKCHYIDLSKTDMDKNSDVPKVGDIINQRGSRTDIDRMNFVETSSIDAFSPSVTLYHGVNSFSLVGKDYVQFGVDKTTNKAFMNVYGDMYVGDRNKTAYMRYTQEEGLVICGKLDVGTKLGDSYLKDLISASTPEGYQEFVEKVTQDLEGLQAQIDGTIDSYFFQYEPSLNNYPASDWDTENEKKAHLNDTFTNLVDGRSWRWSLDGTYKWVEITDTATTKALALAGKAQDTADGKRRVFVDTPYPPYDKGDLWSRGSDYPLMICINGKSKDKGEVYEASDWDYADNNAKLKEEMQDLVGATKDELNNAIGQAKNEAVNNANAYTDEGKKALQASIDAMESSKANLDDVYTRAQADGKISDSETKAINAAKAQADAAIALSEVTIKAYADGIVDDEEAARIKQAQENLAEAKEYAEEQAQAAKSEIENSYLFQALQDAQSTEIANGLVLTSLIQLRDTQRNIMSGINGLINASKGDKSIATWWGGDMLDLIDYYRWDGTQWVVKSGLTAPSNIPSGLIRMDGTGYLAKGKFWWDNDGKIYADPTALFLSFDVNAEEGTLSATILDIRDKQTEFANMWTEKTDSNGTKYLYTTYPLVTQGGVTMYAGTSGLDVEGIYDGLPIDGKTIYWDNGVLKAVGGGGTADAVAWENITGKPSFATVATSGSYNDLLNKPTLLSSFTNDLGFVTSSDIPSTYAWSAITNKPTTLMGYGITDGDTWMRRLDTRSVNPSPYRSTYTDRVSWHLKYNETIGITTEGTYSGVLLLSPWSTSGGGSEHQLAFGTNGRIYHRHGAASWSAWDEIITNTSLSSTLSGYLPLSGGTITISSYQGMVLKHSTTSAYPLLWFANGGGNIGAIGVDTNKNIVFDNGTSAYTVLHSSNYTSYTYSKSDIDSKLSGYLPLSGGELYNGVDNNPLTIRGYAEDSYIGFEKGNGTTLGAIGINVNLGVVYWDDTNKVNRILLHEGNYTSYTYSQSTIDSKLSGYLPLSGGTITGGSGVYSPLIVKNSSSEVWIQFQDSVGSAHIGTNKGVPSIYLGSGSNMPILHSGNYSSYALPLTGGTLTGKLTINTSSYGNQLEIYRNQSNGNSVIRFSNSEKVLGGIGICGSGGLYPYQPIFDEGLNTYQIYHTGNLTKLSQLTNDSGFITSSASISGNAATATKLATARTIWGQSFDGTGNVSGDLSSVGIIQFSNEKSFKIRYNGFYPTSNSEDYWWGVSRYDTNVAISVAPVSGVFQTRYATYLATSSGNVGIGTTSPSYKLHVNGSLNATTIYQNGTSLDSLLNAKLNSSSYTAADVLAKLKTVDGSGSGLDADLLDGVHLMNWKGYQGIPRSCGNSTFTTVNQYFGNGNIVVFDPLPTDSNDNDLGANTVIVSYGENVHRNHQLAYSIYQNHNPKYRRNVDGTWSEWKTFAFTDSNVASATKLQTARTIWGQSFDGSGNVSGDLNGVGRIIRTEPTAVDMDLAGNFIFKNPNSVASNYWHIDTSDGTLIFVVHNNGNVGIGTTRPAYKLDVNGTIRFASKTIWGQSFDGTGNVSGNLSNVGNITTNSSNTDIYLQQSTDSRSWWTGIGISSGDDKYVIYDATAKQHRLSIDTSGNVGIGTVTPIEKLHVEGKILSNSIRIFGAEVTDDSKGLFIQASDKTSRAWITWNGNIANSDYLNIATRYGNIVLAPAGNVGIGTTSPSYKLHVEGSIYSSSGIRVGSSSYGIENIELYGTRPYIDFHYGSSTADYTTRLIEGLSGQLTCTGKFRIGLGYTTSTDYNFYVSGSAYISSNLLTGGGITMYSARVLKNVIDEDGLSLRELSVIKPTRYTWKDKRDERLHIGGIADDIQQVLPEVVYRTPDGILTMDYGNAAFAIASSLIKPMIEHESEIVSLKRKVRELEEEVKRLRA